MPSRGRKFITEFLLPSLNKEIFGPRLKWLDIKNKVFQIQWNHKSASDWTTNDAVVFAAWDKRKGHYNPDNKEYYPKSKQRFRAALYKFIKLKHITELYSEDKYTKIYCIGDGRNISRTHISDVKNEKESDRSENSEIEEKQNPEDLVIDWNSIWNANLLTEPQESCLTAYHNTKMQKESFIKEEQVVTDGTYDFNQGIMHYENQQNYITSVNSLTDNKKEFSGRETSNIMKESEDVESLHVEFHFVLDTVVYKKVNMENDLNDNFHDYLCTDTLKQMEFSNHEFPDTDEYLSFDLPLPCI